LQAKTYLSLIGAERNKVQTISQSAGIDRSNTYRIIGQLQKFGLVEKILGKPTTYRARPLQEGISSLLASNKEHYNLIKTEAGELLHIVQTQYDYSCRTAVEHSISLTSGFRAGGAGYSRDLRNARESLDYLCIDWKKVVRWFERFQEDYIQALSRGVEIRCIAQIPLNEKKPPIVQKFLETGFFKIRSASTAPHAGIDIWDRKTVHIIMYPGLELDGLEVIQSSNPALVELAQNLFETKWQLAVPAYWQEVIEIQT